MGASLVAGVDCPRTTGEFRGWFSSGAACRDYLAWVRWPDGFACPACGGAGWAMADGTFRCRACLARTSVTAGTLFDHARTPLTVWFELCWRFATSKQGVSAREAMRDLGIGSYRTAWGMCQRLRRVLVRPGRERLSGVVEVDETFVGGVEPGLAGGRARGKKSLVAVAVETPGRPRLGRARLQVVSDASAETLGRFVRDHVEPGSVVVTDAWSGYTGQALAGYSHRVVNQSQALRDGAAHDGLPPAAHRVAALLKRWLLATHQGSASAGRLQDYLDEWVFRFNRRRSRHRGLVFYRVIQLAVGHEPVRYRQLIHEPRDPDDEPGGYPRGRGGRPESIKPQVKGYPWRSQRD